MKLFFPNQKGEQIALAKNQDGARGDDLPNQHKTGTFIVGSRIFSQRTFIVGDNWRRRCWAAIARCRIPK